MDIKPRTNLLRTKSAGLALLVLTSAGAGFLGGWAGAKNLINGNLSGGTKAQQQVVLNESQLISDIAKNVGPSVVSVNVISQQQAQGFFGDIQNYEAESAGTGFIIRDDGIIMTNRHVVPSSNSEVTVTLADGTELDDVEIIGRTSDNDPLDVAFLKIKDTKGKKLTTIKIGDSSKIQVGAKVVAIGNALGQFQNTVTSGIISGYGRSVEAGNALSSETLQNLFQTDAAINEGNSGGPLVNINGEVIGVNTAIAAGGAENIGFAIPINDAKGLISSILDKGKLERAYLGVRYVTLTDDVAFQFNIDTKRGAFIPPARGGTPSIVDNSPAAKAGLKERDIITHIDGTAIDEKNSLTSLVGRKQVGDEVELTVVRDNKEQKIKIKLEAAPQG